MQLARKRQGPAPRLRFIQSAAAFLPDRLRQQLEDYFGVPVIDVYGMSEAGLITGTVIEPRVRARPWNHRQAGRYGVRDLFARRSPKLPIGEVGEVRVKGPSVTPGYLLDDAANAARL